MKSEFGLLLLLALCCVFFDGGVAQADKCGAAALQRNNMTGLLVPALYPAMRGGQWSASENECVCNAGFSGAFCHIPLVPLLSGDRSDAAWTVLPLRINASDYFYEDVTFTPSVSGTVVALPQFASAGVDPRFEVFAQKNSLPVSRSMADPQFGGITGTNTLLLPTAARWLVWVEPRSRMAPLGAPVAVRLCQNDACLLDPCGNVCSDARSFCNAATKRCECAPGFADPPACMRVTGSISCPDDCSNAGTCDAGGICKCDEGRAGVNCSLKMPLADTSGVVIGALAGVVGLVLLVALIAFVVWCRKRKSATQFRVMDDRKGRGDVSLGGKDDVDDDSGSF
jgi:hypothetical protein